MRNGFLIISSALLAAATLLAAPAEAATIQVDTPNDELNTDADCSLREAVQAANTNDPISGCVKGQASQRDTIKLAPGELYELGISSTDEDANANGDLDFAGGGPVRLKGNARGMSGPLVYTQQDDRVLDVPNGGGAVSVQKLNLEGGDVSGLGAGGDVGGVIRADGPLKVDDVNLEDGKALRGGAIFATEGSLTITDSFIGQNDATAEGGGVFAVGMKRLKVSRSGLDSNEVVATNAGGGGVWTNADRTQIVDTEATFNSVETMNSNGTAVGGGVFSASEKLQIRRSLIEGNAADDAGGASSSFGAGVNSLGAKVEIVNSTFYGNDTDGSGGAIRSRAGSVSHVTFSANTATDAGDDMSRASGAGPLKIRNSIIPGGGGFTDLCAGDPGSFVSKGYSVIQFDDPTCAFLDSDALVTDVGFADATPLPNGGETFTMGIAGSSPAKDLIPKRKCKVAQKEDQRDFKRPKGKKCDAGAFERGANP